MATISRRSERKKKKFPRTKSLLIYRRNSGERKREKMRWCTSQSSVSTIFLAKQEEKVRWVLSKIYYTSLLNRTQNKNTQLIEDSETHIQRLKLPTILILSSTIYWSVIPIKKLAGIFSIFFLKN